MNRDNYAKERWLAEQRNEFLELEKPSITDIRTGNG